MLKLLLAFMFTCTLASAAPKLKIHIVHQKEVEATGHPYGSPGGIYFSYTGLEPFIMYGLEYSHDMKTWTHIYNFGTVGVNTTSPLFHWYQVPPQKCFYRIKQLW